MSKTKEYFIYVLELNEGKFYVGETNDLGQRLYQHVHTVDQSSLWVQQFGFKRVIYLEDASADKLERLKHEAETAIDMINEFGLDHVRGGPFLVRDNKLNRIQVKGWLKNRGRVSEAAYPFWTNKIVAKVVKMHLDNILLEDIAEEIRLSETIPFSRSKVAFRLFQLDLLDVSEDEKFADDSATQFALNGKSEKRIDRISHLIDKRKRDRPISS